MVGVHPAPLRLALKGVGGKGRRWVLHVDIIRIDAQLAEVRQLAHQRRSRPYLASIQLRAVLHFLPPNCPLPLALPLTPRRAALRSSLCSITRSLKNLERSSMNSLRAFLIPS